MRVRFERLRFVDREEFLFHFRNWHEDWLYEETLFEEMDRAVREELQDLFEIAWDLVLEDIWRAEEHCEHIKYFREFFHVREWEFLLFFYH